MPSRPARTARSSSRSSKSAEGTAGSIGLPAAPPDATAVAVGDLGSPHGLRGQLHLWPHQPGAPSLAPGLAVLLERDGTWLSGTIAHVAPHGRGMLIAFDGIEDRTAAQRLTGLRVLVHEADLPEPDEGEFYHHELHGFAMVTTDGRALGTIAETFSTGLNDVGVVRDGEREHLIPIIEGGVREIDPGAVRDEIEPMR